MAASKASSGCLPGSGETITEVVGDRVDVKLGFSCNNRCLFCVQGDKRHRVGDLKTAEIRERLKDARQHADNVVFTGGEVTLRRDLVELVAFAKSLGFQTKLKRTDEGPRRVIILESNHWRKVQRRYNPNFVTNVTSVTNVSGVSTNSTNKEEEKEEPPATNVTNATHDTEENLVVDLGGIGD